MADRLDFNNPEQVAEFANKYSFEELHKLMAEEEQTLDMDQTKAHALDIIIKDDKDRVTFYKIAIEAKHKALLLPTDPK